MNSDFPNWDQCECGREIKFPKTNKEMDEMATMTGLLIDMTTKIENEARLKNELKRTNNLWMELGKALNWISVGFFVF